MIFARPRFILFAACIGLAACGEDAPPAKPDYDFTPLAKWVGKSPHTPIDDITFIDVPELDKALGSIVIGHRIVESLHLRGPDAPVAEVGGKIIAWSCEPENCAAHNWAIVATPATGQLDVCYYDMVENGPLMTWFSTARKKPFTTISEDENGCPSVPDAMPAALKAAGLEAES